MNQGHTERLKNGRSNLQFSAWVLAVFARPPPNDPSPLSRTLDDHSPFDTITRSQHFDDTHSRFVIVHGSLLFVSVVVCYYVPLHVKSLTFFSLGRTLNHYHFVTVVILSPFVVLCCCSCGAILYIKSLSLVLLYVVFPWFESFGSPVNRSGCEMKYGDNDSFCCIYFFSKVLPVSYLWLIQERGF